MDDKLPAPHPDDVMMLSNTMRSCAPGPAIQPYEVLRPACRSAPVLISSPHSGRAYSDAFLAASRLDRATLRQSEDCFVDDLLLDAPGLGIPLLRADFPRAFCDVNREPWELDPTMFADKLPPWCNTRTARVSAGFGTIARQVSSGKLIYSNKLLFAEAQERIRTCWQPYHDTLQALINETLRSFGRCLLLDCHSMPSPDGPPRRGQDPDFILGDVHGTSCDPAISQAAQNHLEKRGYVVRRNDPYAGGYVTRHYGQPRRGVHALQIEISRGLYLDQKLYKPLPAFGRIRELMTSLVICVIDVAAHLPD